MKTYGFKDEEPVLILQRGGLIAFPTETVYGIGCRFDRSESYERLNRVKRRPPEKPYTVMLSDIDAIEKYALLKPSHRTLINRFMPGEVTFVLERKDSVPDIGFTGSTTVGIRVPGSTELRDFLKRVGVPLLVPSANRSGEKPAASASEVIEIFDEELDGVIDGSLGGGIPSTVVLLTGDVPVLLREGAVPFQEIIDTYRKEVKA